MNKKTKYPNACLSYTQKQCDICNQQHDPGSYFEQRGELHVFKNNVSFTKHFKINTINKITPLVTLTNRFESKIGVLKG